MFTEYVYTQPLKGNDALPRSSTVSSFKPTGHYPVSTGCGGIDPSTDPAVRVFQSQVMACTALDGPIEALRLVPNHRSIDEEFGDSDGLRPA